MFFLVSSNLKSQSTHVLNTDAPFQVGGIVGQELEDDMAELLIMEKGTFRGEVSLISGSNFSWQTMKPNDLFVFSVSEFNLTSQRVVDKSVVLMMISDLYVNSMGNDYRNILYWQIKKEEWLDITLEMIKMNLPTEFWTFLTIDSIPYFEYNGKKGAYNFGSIENPSTYDIVGYTNLSNIRFYENRFIVRDDSRYSIPKRRFNSDVFVSNEISGGVRVVMNDRKIGVQNPQGNSPNNNRIYYFSWSTLEKISNYL